MAGEFGEPWEVTEGGLGLESGPRSWDGDNPAIIRETGDHTAQDVARIVACVNFLDGVDTATLGEVNTSPAVSVARSLLLGGRAADSPLWVLVTRVIDALNPGTPQPPAVMLALAVLRGDTVAGFALADEVMAAQV